MSTKWTDALLAEVKQLADKGYSAKYVSSKLKVPLSSLAIYSGKQGIKFQRMPKRNRPPAGDAGYRAIIQSEDQARAAARLDLDREIAEARAEMATAPLYRGWPT